METERYKVLGLPAIPFLAVSETKYYHSPFRGREEEVVGKQAAEPRYFKTVSE